MTKLNIIKDKEYRNAMQQTVLPFLNAQKEKGSFARVSGQNLNYEHFPALPGNAAPAGDIVMVHGFTENISKLYETAWYFLNSGFRVWLLQQRGHGASYRTVKDPSLVHIRNYKDLVEDLHYFVAEIVRPALAAETAAAGGAGSPLYLFGHSMGGGVSALYLERYPDDFKKAILSSPMLEISAGNIPVPVAVGFARLMIRLRKGNTYMPGSTPFSEKPDFENSCTTCPERYNDYFEAALSDPELQMSAPSVQTSLQFLYITREAMKPSNIKKVKAKVLLLQAGLDNMVLPGAQDSFISQVADGRIVRFPEAKHEIYRCCDTTLERYWDAILSFLSEE